jgi:hypothetical protein
MDISLIHVVEWIELHPKTVDIFQWVVLAFVAWVIGAWRYLRTKFRSPSIEIESFTSRCGLQELGEIDGINGHTKALFLLEVGINNPTPESIHVREFNLSIKTRKKWQGWIKELNPATLPRRVRKSIGETSKLLRNWFSHFEEGNESLTIRGEVGSREYCSGFLLFVSVTWGTMRPLVVDGAIPVKIKAKLTTGEVLSVKSRITVVEDLEIIEEMVPGVFEYSQHRSTWNIVRRK